jgi:hypothetical protein
MQEDHIDVMGLHPSHGLLDPGDDRVIGPVLEAMDHVAHLGGEDEFPPPPAQSAGRSAPRTAHNPGRCQKT